MTRLQAGPGDRIVPGTGNITIFLKTVEMDFGFQQASLLMNTGAFTRGKAAGT